LKKSFSLFEVLVILILLSSVLYIFNGSFGEISLFKRDINISEISNYLKNGSCNNFQNEDFIIEDLVNIDDGVKLILKSGSIRYEIFCFKKLQEQLPTSKEFK
jgi:hypothetical protein